MSDIKVNMGSGGIKIPGYIGVDLFHKDAEVKADIAATPYKPDTVSAIFCSHVIEHISPPHFFQTLAHWHRILVPNGIVEILCPNAIIYLEEQLGHLKSNNHNMSQTWGLINVLGLYDKGAGMANKNFFTIELLKWYLIETKFKVLNIIEQETRVKSDTHIEYRPKGDIFCQAQVIK